MFKLKFTDNNVVCDCPNELYLFYKDVDYLLSGAKTHSPCLVKPMIFKEMYKNLFYFSLFLYTPIHLQDFSWHEC